MRCIICGKETEESKEHIIPEAMGNTKFVTKMVCNVCNNKLGANVDNYLTDYIIVKMMRKSMEITGKEDKQVKIFPSYLQGSDGKKYTFENDTPKLVPIAKEKDSVLRIEAQSIDEAMNLARKKLLRNGITEEKVEQILSEVIKFEGEESNPPEFCLTADIDKSKYLLSAIKIAYEYGYEELGEKYYDDKIAIILRNQLYNAVQSDKKSVSNNIDYEIIRKHAHVMDIITLNMKNIIEPVIHTMKPPARHVVILSVDMDNKIVCNIILLNSNITTFTVLLSENARKYNMKDVRMVVVLEDNTVYKYGKDERVTILK